MTGSDLRGRTTQTLDGEPNGAPNGPPVAARGPLFALVSRSPALRVLLLVVGALVAACSGGSSVSEDEEADVAQVKQATCTAATLVSDDADYTVVPGPTVRWTATGTCGSPSTKQYQFQVRDPNLVYTVVQNWGSSAVYDWPTANLPTGDYQVQVRVRDTPGSDTYYQTSVKVSFALNETPVCTSVSTTMSLINGELVFNSATQGCPIPQFEYWHLPPGGVYEQLRAYAEPNPPQVPVGDTYKWAVANQPPGTHNFKVYARGRGSRKTYDVQSSNSYNLLSATPCLSANGSFSPLGHAPVGSLVTISPTSTNCSLPNYTVLAQPPGGAYRYLQGWSASSLINWNTLLSPPGTYVFQIWSRAGGTAGNYDSYESKKTLSYILDANPPTHAVSIGGGFEHMCELLGNGQVGCWGYNDHGELGNGSQNLYSATPVAVTGLTQGISLASGHYHNCAVIYGGAVQCWGSNGSGQLGNGTNSGSLVPVPVNGIPPANPVSGVDYNVAVSVAAGKAHSCALIADGTVRCWGFNSRGQLGDRPTDLAANNDRNAPVLVQGITDAIQVSGGSEHTCALRRGGTVKCWGRNDQGQLGNNTRVESTIPVDVVDPANPAIAFNNVAAISVSDAHSCALRNDHKIYCWGANSSEGVLGNNSSARSLIPAQVVGIDTATSVAAGRYHSCAVLQNGSIMCWGHGTEGELGNTPAASSAVPVAVVGITNATSVGVSSYTTCATLANNTAKCWGYGAVGTLGTGSTASTNTPTTIPNPPPSGSGGSGGAGGAGGAGGSGGSGGNGTITACTTNANCPSGNVCGIGMGPRFGLPEGTNVCWPQNPCATTPASACGTLTSTCGLCGDKEPGCQNDSQCVEGLTCWLGGGPSFDFAQGVNVCAQPKCTDGTRVASDCGAASATCGHCSPRTCTSDSDCVAGESCGAANGTQFGLSPSTRVCWPISCPDSTFFSSHCGATTAPCGSCSCVPYCVGKTCGGDPSDGCGGQCTGFCGIGEVGCGADSHCTEGTSCSGRTPGSVTLNVCVPPGCLFNPRLYGCGYPGASCGPSCTSNPTCASNADCPVGYVCGDNNGYRYGVPGSNVCEPVDCAQNAAEAGCGSYAAPCGICECTPACAGKHCGDADLADGCGARCQATCANHESGCSIDSDCEAGLVCVVGAGARVGNAAGSNVCMPAICQAPVVQPPNCGAIGAPCGVCPSIGTSITCADRECGNDPATGDQCGPDCGTGSFCSVSGKCRPRTVDTPISVDVPGGDSRPVTPPTSPAASDGLEAIAGSFSVTDQGAADYVIPLGLPPGRNGIEPALALHYTSTTGNGALGVGWSIDGLSTIDRCVHKYSSDGHRRQVSLDASDTFCLDGQRLVSVGGSSTEGTIEYRTEIETFSKIVAEISEEQPSSFTVYTKDGRILRYGSTSDSRGADGQGALRIWALSRIEDRFGNFVSIKYRAGGAPVAWMIPPSNSATELLPDSISYTGHGNEEGDRGVRFEYADTRADTLQGFMPGGGFLSRTKRLDTIRISSRGATVRRYELYYQVAQNQTSRLTSIKECAGDGSPCKAPSTFQYFDDLGFFPGPDAPTSPETGAFVPWSTPLATFQGQDRLAIMTQTGIETVSQPIPGEIQIAASIIFAESPFVGAALHAINKMGAQASVSPISRAAILDFAQHTSTGGWPCGLVVGVDAGAIAYQNIWRSSTTGEDHVFYDCSQKPYAPRPSWMVDIDGDGIQDKLWCSYELPGGDTLNFRLSHRAAYGAPPWDATSREGTIPFGLTSSAASPTLCNTSQTTSFTFDVDGDGTGNLVYWQPDPLSSAGQWRAVAYDPASGPYFVNLGVEGDRVAFPVLRNYNFVIDANGDGLKDILSLLSPDHSPAEHPVPVLWLNDGRHLRRTTLEAGSAAAVAPYYPGHVIDYDHDGIEDIIHPSDSLKDHVEGIGAPPTWMLRRIRDGKLTIESLGTSLLTYPGTLGDFTGDGNPDVALTTPGSNRILVMAGAGRKHGLLKVVTDGLGRGVEVKYDVTNPEGVATYRSDIITYNDGVSCVWPTSCLPSVDHALVSSYVRQYLTDRSSGGTTVAGSVSFAYQNARSDLGGAGWLGFGLRTITEHDAAGGFIKKTEVRGRRPVNSVDEAPFPERYVRVLDALPAQVVETYPHASSTPAHGSSTVPNDDHLVVWSTFDWHQQVSDKGIPFAVLGNKRVVTQEFYGESPVNLFERVEALQVDQFGNVYDLMATEQDFVTEFLGAQGQPVPGSQTIEHVGRVFEPTSEDIDAWLISRPDSETVESQARCSSGVTSCTPPSKTRHSTFHYEPGTTLLREVIREPGDPHLEQTTQYIPDALGNIESVTVSAPGGHFREMVIGYDDRRLFPISVTNRKGQVTQLRYDDRFGRIALSVDPNGIDETFAFDDFGNLRRHHGPGGDTEIDYDSASFHLGPVWTAPMPLPAVLRRTARRVGGETLVEEFNGLGQVVQRTTSGLLGATVMEEFTYDVRGRLYRATRPHLQDNYLQGFVEYGYDALDRVTTQKSPDGGVTKSTYGNVAALAYDFPGKRVPGAMNVAEITDPNGHSTLMQSDRRGQPLRVTDALDQSTNYIHGPFGTLLSVVAPDGSIISHDYDAYNRLIGVTDAAWGGTYASVYNGLDEVETSYDPTLRATSVIYDEIGRVSEVDDADGLTQFIYDGDGTRPNEIGRLIEAISSSGQHTTYGYEAPGPTFNRGLPTTVTRNLIAPVGGGQLELTTTRHYDQFGRVNQIDYPAPSASPLSVTYEFDSAGHVFKARNTSVAETIYWELLEADQGARIHRERLGTDRLTQKDYWPLTGRIKKIETKRAGATIQSLDYAYDLAGNLTTRLDDVAQTSETFGYDAIDRLVSSVNASGVTIGTWAYTPLKGRLSSQAGVGSYSYHATGRDWVQSAGPYEYEPDALGNTRTRGNINDPGGTQYIDYTTFGLPSHIRKGDGPSATTSSFAYDADGNRAIKQSGSRVTYYAGDLYQAVVDGGSVAHRFTIYAGGRAVAQIAAEDGVEGGDALSYLHDDVLGSIQTVSGTTNRPQNFAPFGASSSPTLDEPLGFTGQEHDPELGLVNMRGRLYDPVLGQFLSPDPVIQQPYGQGLNRFAYVLNNPLSYTDPSGFTPEGVGETLTAAFVFGGRLAFAGAAIYGFGWAKGPTQGAPSAGAAAMGSPGGAAVGGGPGGASAAGAPGGASSSDLASAAGGLGLLANVAAGVSDMISAGSGVHRVLPPTAGSHAASSGGVGSPSFGRTSQNPISPRTTAGGQEGPPSWWPQDPGTSLFDAGAQAGDGCGYCEAQHEAGKRIGRAIERQYERSKLKGDVETAKKGAYIVAMAVRSAWDWIRVQAQEYKVPKPGVSGKEGAKDVPSWARGNRPRVGEAGKDFAKRLLDEKYGPGNWKEGPDTEFNKVRKWGDRAFQDP